MLVADFAERAGGTGNYFAARAAGSNTTAVPHLTVVAGLWYQPDSERRDHYHPEREHYGNYVPTILPRRYDAFLYLDETQALRPLYEVQPQEEGEVPETYPSGV